MGEMRIPAPWHLWMVGVIALLFNAIGAVDYTMSMIDGAAYQASVGMTPDQIAFYRDLPFWMKVVWPLGVWSAVAGSVLILLRKKVAAPVFGLSLAAFLLNVLHTFVLTDGGRIMGPAMAVTSAVIATLLLFFMWYAHAMTKRGVMG